MPHTCPISLIYSKLWWVLKVWSGSDPEATHPSPQGPTIRCSSSRHCSVLQPAMCPRSSSTDSELSHCTAQKGTVSPYKVGTVQRKICPAMPRTVACLQGADMVACACRGPIKPPHPPPITTLSSDHTRYSRQRLECKYKYKYGYKYRYRFKYQYKCSRATYHDPQVRRQTILPPKGWTNLFWRQFQN